MERQDLNDREIIATIFHKLARKGAWGEAYLPYDTVTGWIMKKMKRDGKRVRKIVDSLIHDGYLISHKGGGTISLNTRQKEEIFRMINEYILR